MPTINPYHEFLLKFISNLLDTDLHWVNIYNLNLIGTKAKPLRGGNSFHFRVTMEDLRVSRTYAVSKARNNRLLSGQGLTFAAGT